MPGFLITAAAATALLSGPQAELLVTRTESTWEIVPTVQSPLPATFRAQITVETAGPNGRSRTQQGKAISVAPNRRESLGSVRIDQGGACRVHLVLFQDGVMVAEDRFICPPQ